MKTKSLKDMLDRIETWPKEAQEELAAIAFEMDTELSGGIYRPTPEELKGIDRGIKTAGEGRFASNEQVETV